ncbi:pyridoxamine 5'-phosphate oxidase family protein [Pseudarthrobacter sp. J75]|uniref:pyridoxamine 5'-phosphate oxidase family protein n=1 Tax=unclassified Pseudarthrobacter TaxID=2647000 RepID=UPI002E81366A|nr:MULTISPECIES: pyridoxamine 5'-phosphate oxidase family protein [unclassified Pseudarthrobacter]MEE2522615.1 pyridoxamine 5'-phosphate oxidase family protein [Pseudarthrobacter sp. J47]MEE2530712.1 pyridoxamine 5'-phosphate oxidase family protein [Pseudarthrobacter sp. J75]MEE2571034.1 pyridoxamine 5'-phosphate oxidase family protein [Pseudarthrobacter sp. J64]
MDKDASVHQTELLPSNECWNFLRQVSVGRLAVWRGDAPDIFPINYTVDHGTIVFRTGAGAKLQAALGDFPVAMEADGVNQDNGLAWSVVVRGAAQLLSSTDDILSTFSLPLFPWEPGTKDHFVRIVPTSISGRRFIVAPPSIWWTQGQGNKPAAME